MKKSLNMLGVVMYIYLITAHVFMLYFWYQWSKQHNFLSTFIIGPIVSEFKGLFFPFFI